MLRIGLPSDLTWYSLLREQGSFVAGILALLAAFIAALPMWLQLRVLRVQTALARREALVARLDALASRREIARQALAKITTDFNARIYPDGGDEEPDINPHWAFDAEKMVGDVVARLTSQQERSLDGEVIEYRRMIVIQRAMELSACLSEIHTPYSADLEDPEYALTEEQVAAITSSGLRAEKNLDRCISEVAKAAYELDVSFKTGLGHLQERIRSAEALVTSK